MKIEPHALELHIVGGGVRQGEAGLKRGQMDVQMMDRRALHQRKGPFVRIAYEREARMLQHELRGRGLCFEGAPVGFMTGNQQPALDQAVQQPRIPGSDIVGGPKRHDGSVDGVTGRKNPSAGITKGTGIGCERPHSDRGGWPCLPIKPVKKALPFASRDRE